MATKRKPAKKSTPRRKPVRKAPARAKSAKQRASVAKSSRPAAKPAKARPKSKPLASRPLAKSAHAKSARPARSGKHVAGARPGARITARGAAKPAGKAAARPDHKAAAKPVVKPIGRLVPAKPIPGRTPPGTKPGSGKHKLTSRPPAEVRPLGVLPPEAMVKTRERQRPAPPPRPLPRAAAPPKPTKGDMDTPRLTKDAIEYFENRLREERAKIMKEMGHLETTVLKVNPRDSAGELSGYSFHMADAGTDSMERELSFDIASKEGRLLREIDDALRRVYNGVYGLCEASGKPIARARLETLPWARYTVEEQEKLEKEQRAGRLPKED